MLIHTTKIKQMHQCDDHPAIEFLKICKFSNYSYIVSMEKLQNKPNLLKYIPFLYVMWSDDLFSPSEISVFTKAIEGDTLKEEEIKSIIRWIDPSNPPSDKTMFRCIELIDHSKIQITVRDTYTI